MAVTTLVTPISGAYTAAYGTLDSEVSLGCVQNGIRMVQQVSKQVITCDTYGDSVVDAVFRGGNVSVILEAIEYGQAVGAMWPYGSNPSIMGLCGRLDVGSSIAQSLLLSAVQGTPANPAGTSGSPLTMQAPFAIIDEGQRTEIMLANMLRTVPLVFRLYPWVDDGAPTVVRWMTYQTTNP